MDYSLTITSNGRENRGQGSHFLIVYGCFELYELTHIKKYLNKVKYYSDSS